MADITADLLFCEDIRDEASGRSSYMGVHDGTVEVPSLPHVLPALAIRAKLLVPLRLAGQVAELLVNLLGTRHKYQIELGKGLAEPPPSDADGFFMVAHFAFRSVEVSAPGVVVVSYKCEGEPQFLGGIEVVLATGQAM